MVKLYFNPVSQPLYMTFIYCANITQKCDFCHEKHIACIAITTAKGKFKPCGPCTSRKTRCGVIQDLLDIIDDGNVIHPVNSWEHLLSRGKKGEVPVNPKFKAKAKRKARPVDKRKQMTREGKDDTNTNTNTNTKDIASDADGEWVSEEEAESVDNRHRMVADSMDVDPPSDQDSNFAEQVAVLEAKLTSVNLHIDGMENLGQGQVTALGDLDRKVKSAMLLLQQVRGHNLRPQIDWLQTEILKDMEACVHRDR